METLNVRIEGSADAPTLVLVHGLCESLRAWDKLVPELVDDFRIVRLDLYGFGDSPAPQPPFHYAIEDQARGVALTLAAAGVERATLVGHSLGGAVAVAAAEHQPELVRSLVLINSPPTVESRLPSRVELALRRPVIGEAAWKLIGDRERRVGLRSAFAPGFKVPQVFVDDLSRTAHAAFAGATGALEEYLAQQPLAARVATLAFPTTVIFGVDDQRVDGRAIAPFDALPEVTVARLERCGHSPMWERPPETAELVRAGAR
jgi:pimeloyl-ACP methyl ester carboxylesterase